PSSGATYTDEEYRGLLAQTDTLMSDPRSLLHHPADLEKQELTVIAWIWARTVKCPNPACGVQMPLARSFALSTKAGKQAWIEPVISPSREGGRRVGFTVKTGAGDPPE